MKPPSKNAEDHQAPADQSVSEPPVQCGIIMPISATETRSEKHWGNVQALLHRAVRKAGMQPLNVWSGEVVDRISERIVGNIFAHDITIADISDLNPNVMLELGLRLASKKPTVVVADRGSEIPFDIRDFHVIQYPPDLTILDMEEFIDQLATSLKAKHAALIDGTYEPFLGKVVVDVATPETRALPMNELILERLDDLAKRISRNDVRSPAAPAVRLQSYNKQKGIIRHRVTATKSTAFYSVPTSAVARVAALLAPHYTTVSNIGLEDGASYIAASNIPPRQMEDPTEQAAAAIVRGYAGFVGVPEAISDQYN